MAAADLFDGQVLETHDGDAFQIRRCEVMPKGLAFYRMTPVDGPNAGNLEFGLTEREVRSNARHIGEQIVILR